MPLPPGFGSPPPGFPPISGMMPRPPFPGAFGFPPKPPREPPCTIPNKTLYINNLNEKIKIADMKKALEAIFKNYGEILGVYARGSLQMRGQAFVAFSDQEAATKALQEVQGFVLFDKPMLIQYARCHSDVVVDREGEDLDKHVEHRKEEKAKREKELAEKFGAMHPGAGGPAGPHPSAFVVPEVPNQILFLENIPVQVQQDDTIEKEFSKFPGLKEVRKVPGKPSIAFVEFETEAQASAAKSTLGGLWPVVPDAEPVKITFAKR
ncbi:hypothetical protein EV182_003114 [Spiromyces aspiralis]|uniref:Uncharacterized protein n=1 Tax=Spiromyces aspiralis TaxID=68401 RepID=A0ACC1HEU2_9FUNG|nr:hypothetical protein EV182_003114 [Spiromyces aspiralis]